MEIYLGEISGENGALTINGVVIHRNLTKGKLKKADVELSDEVQDPNNPNTSTFFLKRTVKLFDEEMVVQMSFEGMVLKMITIELAELFNKRNMIKLTGGKMDEQMISSAFNRLKTSLKKVMNKEGESIEEDNVHYYLYEREEFGIMVVNDTNMDRVSLVIAY